MFLNTLQRYPSILNNKPITSSWLNTCLNLLMKWFEFEIYLEKHTIM
jgi:hypothetical protein